MLTSVFTGFDLVELPVFAMVLFMATFSIVIVRVMRSDDPQLDVETASLPLFDDSEDLHG